MKITFVAAALVLATPALAADSGEYLARAADCVACHTAPRRYPLRRRAGIQAAVRNDLFAEHHPRPGNRRRRLHRRRVGRGTARRHRPWWTASFPGHAVQLLHADVVAGRAGDQGLPVQPEAGARAGNAGQAALPVQPALGHGVLEHPQQPPPSFRSGFNEIRRLESRRLPGAGARPLRPVPHAAQLDAGPEERVGL